MRHLFYLIVLLGACAGRTKAAEPAPKVCHYSHTEWATSTSYHKWYQCTDGSWERK